MKNIATEAWVLYQGEANGGARPASPAEFRRETFTFPGLTETEVLVEPVYGSWEGNMGHAIDRKPVDVCRQRGEEKVVLGNSGVVRVVEAGSAVTAVKVGDLCIIFGNTVFGRFGHMKKAFAYDAPNTVGILAKRTKMPQHILMPIPENTRYSLKQWAAFPIRYITAWANWKAAHNCFRSLLPEEECATPFVWGWGGGTTMAELSLAKFYGCRPSMISGNPDKLGMIEGLGIEAIDRRQFIDLNFDEKKYQADPEYKQRYDEAEKIFLNLVNEKTGGAGVSIFVDYIGLPVSRPTLKALSSPGVITTAGWKFGMKISTLRAVECINWHVHVHTHYARFAEGLEAINFAEEKGWMPEVDGHVYGWDDIPRLAEDYQRGRIDTYFPLYEVNGV
jgi:NADPH:quinone reductase-like Zn-dependent oxidoreductase